MPNSRMGHHWLMRRLQALSSSVGMVVNSCNPVAGLVEGASASPVSSLTLASTGFDSTVRVCWSSRFNSAAVLYARRLRWAAEDACAAARSSCKTGWAA